MTTQRRGDAIKKIGLVGLLTVVVGAVAITQRQEISEAAKRVCAVCAPLGDPQPKEVYAWVDFAGERFPVHSPEHKEEFNRTPQHYADALHAMGLHDH